jgi:hypothetical protein
VEWHDSITAIALARGVVGEVDKMRIGALDVRQRHRIHMITLLARHRCALPIPGRANGLIWIDRTTHRPQR